MAQSNTSLSPVPVSTGKIPKEGPVALPVIYDFSGGTTSYVTDMVFIHQQGRLTMVQTLYLDNSLNNGTLTVSCSVLNQSFTLQPGAQGYFPVLCSGQVKFTVSSAGSVNATVAYINTAISGFQWSATPNPATISGTVTVTDTILDALVANGRLPVLATAAQNTSTDRSGTITAGGTAQTIMNANAARKGWMIQNIDETNLEELGVRSTGTAALLAAGTFTLSPSAGAGYPGGMMQGVDSGAISVVAATTGHKFTAIEW